MPSDPAIRPESGFSAQDDADLREAVALLEQDTFSETIMNTAGKFVGGGLNLVTRFVPAAYRANGSAMVADLLAKAFDKVVLTIDHDGKGLTGRRWIDAPLSSSWIDGASAILAGALGGAGGLATTAIELPVTTAFLMRAIAQIAVREGEDLRSDDAKLECLKVFALGGAPSGEAADTGYYALRLAVAEAAPKLAHKTIQDLLPRLLAKVAERFSVPVTTKIGSQAAPGVGGAAGALINLAFVDHFQRKALGHFRIRRLERRYGPDAVRGRYEQLRSEWLAARSARGPASA
ncbi:EcsC family protein [Phenylobacterium sp.]|jgi:hypothetical protein|uniref:EcsC family protein n=1 Tax=Phenylobacterium sp. TaxID=1871053 RepID=UPI002F3E541B